MPFFIKKAGVKNGKRPRTSKGDKAKVDGDRGAKGKRRRLARLNEEIESDSEIDSDEADGGHEADLSDEEVETAEEKKLRLAKEYLRQMNEAVAEDEEDEEDTVGKRLQTDALEQSGKLFKCVADQYTCPEVEQLKTLKGHKDTVTCAVISPDSKTAFSGSRDGTIIKWCLKEYRRLHVVPGGRKGTEKTHVGHTSSVLCCAISSDGKFLATGDTRNQILIWDPETCQIIHTFRAHRKPVTGLVFRKNHHDLYSTSYDRLMKAWNLDEMAYVEASQGTDLTAIDALIQDRAITVGGREREVLIHNLPLETIRKFYAHTESDCVALINESHFVIGGQDNSLSVWNVNKKKPLCVVKNAHSGCPETVPAQGDNWVTAVTSLQFSDLIASGSKDGFIRLWKCSQDFRHLTPLFSIPVAGFINSLKFSSEGDFLLAAQGRQHRLGSWWTLKNIRSNVLVIPLPKK